ncbi:MAG: glycosyltransferase family 2 protein [Pseudomarimonas sp.]
MRLSVIIPAKNESANLGQTLARVKVHAENAEVIVVNDGSSDATAEIARQFGATVLSVPYTMGNGAAIKRGARHASGEVLIFLDADGQHDPADIAPMLERLANGYDMVVGARDSSGQASRGRSLANAFYNKLASWMTGHDIADLTSGFRVVYRSKFVEFINLLPNGFSYPTTITMAFFRSAYSVCYHPIKVSRRKDSHSHIRPLQDGFRFLLIIFKIATLYAPLKIFVPVSMTFFSLGLGNYAYTYMMYSRLTNMSVLLFSASVIIFLIGLVSEQISAMLYSNAGKAPADK